MQYKKIYVEVIAHHDLEGNVKPMAVFWRDGRRFDIDRIIDRRKAASLKAGGRGIRYTVMIGNQRRFLFDDCGRWFVEGLG